MGKIYSAFDDLDNGQSRLLDSKEGVIQEVGQKTGRNVGKNGRAELWASGDKRILRLIIDDKEEILLPLVDSQEGEKYYNAVCKGIK